MNDRMINAIIARSTTLYERIEGCPIIYDKTSTISMERLKNLKDTIYEGDYDIFLKKYKEDNIVNYLYPAKSTYNNYNCSWRKSLIILIEILEKCKKNNFTNIDEFSMYIVNTVSNNIIKYIDIRYKKLFNNKGIKSLKNIFLNRIETIWLNALKQEYFEYEYINKSIFSVKLSVMGVTNSLLKDFIDNLYKNKFEKFLIKYAFLSRITSVLIENFVNFINEFIHRFIQDKNILVSNLLINKKCKIDNFIISGDYHNSGKGVCIISFDDKLKIVYKPKSLKIELELIKFINWLNESFSVKLKSPIIINKKDYGWINYIETKKITDQKLYYYRIGILLGMAYLFDATDLHYENIITHGNYPIIIDMETFFHQEYFKSNTNDIDYVVEKKFWNSALKSMILPQWMEKDGNKKNIGSIILNENLKTNDKINIIQYVINGFEIFLKHVLKNKEYIIKIFLKKFKNCEVRYILRPTSIYDRFLERVKHPKFLMEGVDFSLEAERLYMTFYYENKYNSINDIIYEEELKSLMMFDIPYFYNYTNRVDLYTQKKIIKNYFLKNSLEQVSNKIIKLNNKLINEQINLIKISFSTFNTKHDYILKTKQNNIKYYKQILDRQIIEKNIFDIAYQILDNSINLKNERKWIGLKYLPRIEQFEFQTLGYDLYSGSTGIALFYSALYNYTKNRKWKLIAETTLNSIKSKILNSINRYIGSLGVGGFVGISSVIYSFYKCSEWLDNEEYKDDALSIIKYITTEDIEKDNKLDIMLGVAGLLQVLLFIFSREKNIEILNLSKKCGNFLLKNLPYNNALGNWTMFPRTGFSHGASGIAVSLSNLYRFTNNVKYLNGVKLLLKYENSFWREKNSNWLDGDINSTFFSNSWCHGASGILFSRIKILNYNLNLPELETDIKKGVINFKKLLLSKTDDLCCGNMGRFIILSNLNLIHDVDSSNLQNKYLSMILHRKNNNKKFSLIPDLPIGFSHNPSLMKGQAGIALALLEYLTNKPYASSILSLE